MSWIFSTALMLAVGFACIYGFCEWFVRRQRDRGGDDGPSALG